MQTGAKPINRKLYKIILNSLHNGYSAKIWLGDKTYSTDAFLDKLVNVGLPVLTKDEVLQKGASRLLYSMTRMDTPNFALPHDRSSGMLVSYFRVIPANLVLA